MILFQSIRKSVLLASACFFAGGFHSQLSAVEPDQLQHYDFGAAQHTTAEYSPFLGISSQLALWENGIVRLAYNHSGARSDISADEIIAKLQTTFLTMENLAGLDFQFLGQSSAGPLDFNDGIVTIGWEQVAGNAIARAGPSGSASFSTVRRLGYLPNVDGSFQFNSLHNGEFPIAVMIHELMHLLGLGHSDNPVSIMTPLVTRFDFPQADDIAALQSMYGPPDTLVIPKFSVQLSGAPQPSFVVDPNNSGLVVRRASASNINDISGFEDIDASFSSRDEIFLRLAYNGAVAGSPLEIYLTDPNGFTSLDSSYALRFDSRTEFFFLSFAEALTPIAGDWKLQVGLRGSLIQELNFNVSERTVEFNRGPTATISTISQGNGLFNLSLTAFDPDGDNLAIDWHIPGEGRLPNAAATLNTNVPVAAPMKMYAAVRDDGIKKDGPSSGIGFGALLSQYLVTPASPNVPTYFAEEKILHIPTLLINGQNFTINLKLTALDGAQFKLMDLYPVANSIEASASIDLSTLEMSLPQIIIQINGVNSELENLIFDFVPGSTPIKFAPRI
jgi:hypothetical protein